MQKTKLIIAMLGTLSLLWLVPWTAFAAYIAEGECFIDTDPGEGNGIQLECVDGACDGEREETEVVIDLESMNLKTGYHVVYCRVKNDAGLWSLSRPIVNDLWVTNPNLEILGTSHVSVTECFFDTDPGIGNGIFCECADGACDEADEEVECTNVSVAVLSVGMHQLYCRTQDSEGSWGTTRRYSVQTYENPTLAASEYFIDTDPGLGNGTTLQPIDWFWDEAEEEINKNIDLSSYANGDHALFVRMKDTYGRWGLPSCQPIGENPCECDLNGDGSCNILDWPLFIEDWGRSDCHDLGIFCECDLNSDGNCNILDWPYFIDDWGQASCSTCPQEW